MFENLRDFGFDRNWKQTISFYIAYNVMFWLLLVVLAFVLVTFFDGINHLDAATRVIEAYTVLFHFLIAVAIIRGKNLQKEYRYYLVGLLAIALGYYFSSIAGLLPILYLTTVKRRSIS